MGRKKKLIQEKPVFNWASYDNPYYLKANKEEKKKERWAWAFFAVLFLGMLATSFVGYHFTNIDESGFCLTKIKTYFPEHQWDSASYEISSNKDVCVGKYTPPEKAIQRDGLKVQASPDPQISQIFELTNPKDIDYLLSDDVWGLGIVVSGLLTFLVGWLFIGSRSYI